MQRLPNEIWNVSGNMKPNKKLKWKVRRRIVNLTLIFCAGCVLYIMFKGTDSRLYETIATNAFFLAGAVIGSYIFGATWDDKSNTEKDNEEYVEYEN